MLLPSLTVLPSSTVAVTLPMMSSLNEISQVAFVILTAWKIELTVELAEAVPRPTSTATRFLVVISLLFHCKSLKKLMRLGLSKSIFLSNLFFRFPYFFGPLFLDFFSVKNHKANSQNHIPTTRPSI